MSNNKQKARPGIGAKGSILTRFIKPKQFVNDKEHRSKIVVEGRFADEKGAEYYEFRFLDEQDSTAPLVYGASRMVRIEEEGNHTMIFTGVARKRVVEKNPSIPWAKSKARQILYDDIASKIVTAEMDAQQVFLMHTEYKEYGWENFAARLKSLLKIVTQAESKAEEDLKAYLAFKKYNSDIPTRTHKGCEQWQGSSVQTLVRVDISNNVHEDIGWRNMWMSRPDYTTAYTNFDLFRDKCKQEIRTAKYYHTLKVYGKSKPK